MRRRALVPALLVLGVVALVALPLAMGGTFAGTDAVVTERLAADGHRPWFESLFSPSREVESGLFALQAAVGGGVLGYVLGRLRGRREVGRVGGRVVGREADRGHPPADAA